MWLKWKSFCRFFDLLSIEINADGRVHFVTTGEGLGFKTLELKNFFNICKLNLKYHFTTTLRRPQALEYIPYVRVQLYTVYGTFWFHFGNNWCFFVVLITEESVKILKDALLKFLLVQLQLRFSCPISPRLALCNFLQCANITTGSACALRMQQV